MSTRFLLETLRQADGGKVECTVETDLGRMRGVIEPTFFEEFTGSAPSSQLSATQKQRILADNQEWLQTEVERQLTFGSQTIVIR